MDSCVKTAHLSELFTSVRLCNQLRILFMTSIRVDLGTSEGTEGITIPSRVRVIETQLNA